MKKIYKERTQCLKAELTHIKKKSEAAYKALWRREANEGTVERRILDSIK
jgi:hypothetical protein